MRDQAISDFTRLAFKFYRQLPPAAQRHMDVDDVASIAHLKIIRKRSKFKNKSSTATWQYRVATNAMRDVVKESKRVLPVVSVDSLAKFSGGKPCPYSSNVGAEKRVERFLDFASPELRHVLVHYYLGRGTKTPRIGEKTLERLRAEVKILRKSVPVFADDFRAVEGATYVGRP